MFCRASYGAIPRFPLAFRASQVPLRGSHAFRASTRLSFSTSLTKSSFSHIGRMATLMSGNPLVFSGYHVPSRESHTFQSQLLLSPPTSLIDSFPHVGKITKSYSQFQGLAKRNAHSIAHSVLKSSSPLRPRKSVKSSMSAKPVIKGKRSFAFKVPTRSSHSVPRLSELPFSTQVRKVAEPYFKQMIEHPFNVGLLDGTLPLDLFKFYLYQDKKYLRRYAEALATTAAKSSDELADKLWDFNRGVLIMRQNQSDDFFELTQETEKLGVSPACFNYINFLIKTAATSCTSVSVAALLPCYWIFSEVRDNMHSRSKEITYGDILKNPYRKGMEKIYNPRPSKSLEKFIAVMDAIADIGDKSQHAIERREEMAEAFYQSCRFEIAFMDDVMSKKIMLPPKGHVEPASSDSLPKNAKSGI